MVPHMVRHMVQKWYQKRCTVERYGGHAARYGVKQNGGYGGKAGGYTPHYKQKWGARDQNGANKGSTSMDHATIKKLTHMSQSEATSSRTLEANTL